MRLFSAALCCVAIFQFCPKNGIGLSGKPSVINANAIHCPEMHASFQYVIYNLHSYVIHAGSNTSNP